MINYSIIIPHYNIPVLLARCIRSIPERDDIQVIVVDDNSPNQETYLSTIPELSRKNVEFYPTKDGFGAGHVRNVGLSHAKGKWLVFADSDDFFVDGFSDILDQYINDEHDIIYFNIKSCDCYDTTRFFPEVNKNYTFQKYYDSGCDVYLRVCYTEPWGKIIRHSVVLDNAIQFQETKSHNDLLFAVRVGLAAKSVLVVNKPLYWYVVREGSLGHQKNAESFSKVCDRMLAWDSTQHLLEQNGIKTNFYLPTWPVVRATKRNSKMYLQLLDFAGKHDISRLRLIMGTLHYSLWRICPICGKITFANMLSKRSLKAFAKRKQQ